MIESDSIAGFKVVTLLTAFTGSAMSLSYAKDLTRTQALVAVATGVAVAVFGAQLLRYYWTLPDSIEPAITFFGGLFAMRAVPAALAAVDALKNLRSPWNKE